MPDNGASRGLLRPEDWRPLFDRLDAERADRPRRPTHAYAQATRRALTERLQTNAARTDSHSGRAA